eukprot:3548246-Pleurochrysis_carterae.AAC.2
MPTSTGHASVFKSRARLSLLGVVMTCAVTTLSAYGSPDYRAQSGRLSTIYQKHIIEATRDDPSAFTQNGYYFSLDILVSTETMPQSYFTSPCSHTELYNLASSHRHLVQSPKKTTVYGSNKGSRLIGLSTQTSKM